MTNFLMDPNNFQSLMGDAGSRAIMEKTIRFFENKGKTKLLDDFWDRVWYRDFLDFLKAEQIFAKLLTPTEYADGDPDCRWDTARNNEYSELLAFYGLGYWYCFQVTILGLGPIWMSDNKTAKLKAARLLKQGAIFAFGLSEKEHGADIYSTETKLTPAGDGTWVANGEKYYIGNGNEAPMVSTFGKVDDGSGDYVFFVTNCEHKQYELKKNVVSHQEYVANFALHDYPITEADILLKGQAAWDNALNTVNIGKFNIGPASIGVTEHCFYESITHAANRKLYGMRVTDMPHVQKGFVDAWLRLMAMKLYQRRATDYFRSASETDRRYLLYNPTSKMKVTTQAETVMGLLWNIIAAKGFERDTFFSMGISDIWGPSKLEGTVHVNVQLIRKFIANYFFNPADYPETDTVLHERTDDYLFRQGPARGLGKVQFHAFEPVFRSFESLPNVARFLEQITLFQTILMKATPDETQQQDPSFALPVGEMFAIVVYGQLILEQAKIDGLDPEIINQIFDFMVRDFAAFGLEIYDNHATNDLQREFCRNIMLVRPEADMGQYRSIWANWVLPLNGAYEMTP